MLLVIQKMYEKILVELFFIKIKIGKILEKFAYNLVHCINMGFFSLV